MNKKVVIGVSLGAVVIVGVGALILTHNNKTEPEPADSESVVSSEMVESGSAGSKPVIENQRAFQEIVFDGDSMVGRAEYTDLTDFKNEQDAYRDELGLTKAFTDSGPMIYATGHQVYSSQTDEYRYIMSGYSPIKLFEGNIQDTTFIREEDSGERIYVFPNKSEEAAFQDDWDSGQRILSGQTIGDHGDIVVDGRLIHSQYTEKDGQMYLNLVEVASAVDPSLYYSEEQGYIYVRPNEFVTVQVPTNAANSQQKKVMHVSGDRFTFNSWTGDSFSISDIPVLDYETTLISAENASKMFGWRMYTDGDVLSIVSDPLNVTNKTAIYTSGSMGLTSVLEKDEFGNEVINTYDSNGTLISSTPFDGTLPENSESEMEEAQSEVIGNSESEMAGEEQ